MDSSRQQPSSKKPTQRKERSLQEILDEFSPLTDITYEPVKVEDRREAYTIYHLPLQSTLIQNQGPVLGVFMI
jgi:hypothetical protein